TRDSTDGRLFVCWQTSIYDGHGHAITDEEFTFGDRAQQGEFDAVCGSVLRLADSFLPPGRRCPRCVAFLRAREAFRQRELRIASRRRIGWLRRVCGRAIPGVSG